MGIVILSEDSKKLLYEGGYMSLLKFRIHIAKCGKLTSVLYYLDHIPFVSEETLKCAHKELLKLGKGAYIFFAHSDCDGIIDHGDCEEMSNFLKSIDSDDEIYKEKLNKYIDGLEYCYKNKQDVIIG